MASRKNMHARSTQGTLTLKHFQLTNSCDHLIFSCNRCCASESTRHRNYEDEKTTRHRHRHGLQGVVRAIPKLNVSSLLDLHEIVAFEAES